MRFSLFLMKIWWAYWNAIDWIDGHLRKHVPDPFVPGAVMLIIMFIVSILSFLFLLVAPLVPEDYIALQYLAAFLVLGVFIYLPMITLIHKSEIRLGKRKDSPYLKYSYKPNKTKSWFDF